MMLGRSAIWAAALLFAATSWGADCGSIPDGETKRLDSPGGPLANATIQDQDGLGTCYANASSLLLQSIAPGNPDLSYLQIGLAYASSKMGKKPADGQKPASFLDSNGHPVFTGGFVCDAINAVMEKQKEGEGLCKRSAVPIEHERELDTELTQASKLMAVYQNEIGKNGDPQFKQAFTAMLAASKDRVCKQERAHPKIHDMALREVLSDVLMKILDQNPGCQIHGLLPAESSICSMSMLMTPVREMTQQPDSTTMVSVDLSESVLDSALGKVLKAKGGYPNYGAYKAALLKQIMTSFAINPKSAAAKSLTDQFNSLSPDNERGLQGDFSQYVQGNCLNLTSLNIIRDQDELLKEFSSNSVLCRYADFVPQIAKFADSIDSRAVKNVDDVVNFIAEGAGSSYDQGMMKLIAPDCGSGDRVQLPQDTSCKPDPVPMLGAETSGWLKQARDQIHSSIGGGRAVGMEYCTRLYDDPSFAFNRIADRNEANRQCALTFNGPHASALIGYRCRNGKMDYLVQNSWGSTWKPKVKRFDSEPGKVWLSEDDLAQNASELQYLNGK